MIKKIAQPILFLVLLSMNIYNLAGQEICIKLKKNNKEVELKDNFQLIIFSFDSVATTVTKPVIKGNCFYMPLLCDTTEKIILLKNKRNIIAVKANISRIDQQMNWNFGIDTKPFDEENSYLVQEKFKDKAKMLIYLDFDPKEKGDGTRVTVIVNDKKKYKRNLKELLN